LACAIAASARATEISGRPASAWASAGQRARGKLALEGKWLVGRHAGQQPELEADHLDTAPEHVEAGFEAIDLHEDQTLVQHWGSPLQDPILDEGEALAIRAQELFGEVQVPARGQEVARLQADLAGEPSLAIAHLCLLHVELVLGDADPSRLPPVEVERNAEADGYVIVRAGRVGLAAEIEHRVRAEAGLEQTASRRIDLGPQGAQLRVAGHRSFHHLIHRHQPGRRRRLSRGEPRADE
jgi:hypothetical protein